MWPSYPDERPTERDGLQPLRTGLTPERATDTYAALANPHTYAFFIGERGWTPDQFEEWLADSLPRLLLP